MKTDRRHSGKSAGNKAPLHLFAPALVLISSRMCRADEELTAQVRGALQYLDSNVYKVRERIEIITIFHAARKWPDSFDL